MRKDKFYVIIILILVVVIQTACNQKNDFKSILISSINKAKKNHKEVSIGKLTKFDWEFLYIFAPYTPTRHIYRSLGFKWDKAESIKLYMREDINLLVFVKKRKVVKYLEFGRGYGDFSKIKSGKIF